MPKGRIPYVVDSNVPIMANGRDGASRKCQKECSDKISAILESGIIVLDDGWEIIREYRKYLKFPGQAGKGDRFLAWIIKNMATPELCLRVPITKIDHQWRQFEEFPDNENLATFDKSDQKFVAVAAVAENATILQASDHKWLKWHETLSTHGINVRFLCEEELRATQSRKSPQ